MKKFKIPREKVVILAKCFGTVPDEPGIFNWFFEPQLQKSKDYINQGGKNSHLDVRPCSNDTSTDPHHASRSFSWCNLQSSRRLPETSPNRLYRSFADPSLRPHSRTRRNNESPPRPCPEWKSSLHRRKLYVVLPVRTNAIHRREERLDKIREYAESVQSLLSRRREGDE